MNKKIISVFFLLIVFISVALTYVYLSQPAADEKKYDTPVEDIDDTDISNEIDNLFLGEDDEIEIGEMI